MVERIQRKRTKGWRMPADTVCVCRPGPFGNPFTAEAAEEAGYRNGPEMAVWGFREWLAGNPAPEFLADCEACDGKGYIARTIHVYEAGCGFSHPDVEELPCKACGGNGWFVCEAEGDCR